MKQQRNASLDLIRLVAILLVIMQHAWSGLGLDEPIVGDFRFIYHAIVIMGVPLFFMLSGALLLSTPHISLKNFLSRRFKRLLIPYLLWATLVYIISAMMQKYPDIQTPTDILHNYLPYLLSGKINASYWYVFVLIGIYLLVPFMQRALWGTHEKTLIQYGLTLWGVWIIIRAYYPQFGSMHYYGASAFMYIGFFLCGYYCTRYLTKERLNRNIGVVGVVTAYALNVWGLATGFGTSIVHALGVISLFLLLKSCILPSKAIAFVTSAGRYTYVIYFVHILVVATLCILDMWGWCPIWMRPIAITLLSFFASYLVAWVFDKQSFIPRKWIGI